MEINELAAIGHALAALFFVCLSGLMVGRWSDRPKAAFIALASGATAIRIVDSDTGELFDRISINVQVISDVILKNVRDTDRDYLIAGEDELLGIRLIADDGGRELRAIDQDVTLEAEGEIQPENMYWDCFTYVVPEDVDEMTFTIVAAGQVHTRTLEVRAE